VPRARQIERLWALDHVALFTVPLARAFADAIITFAVAGALLGVARAYAECAELTRPHGVALALSLDAFPMAAAAVRARLLIAADSREVVVALADTVL